MPATALSERNSAGSWIRAVPTEVVAVEAAALGGFNALISRLDLGTEVTVPFAWHHANTELPMHLPVTETLRKLPEIKKL